MGDKGGQKDKNKGQKQKAAKDARAIAPRTALLVLLGPVK